MAYYLAVEKKINSYEGINIQKSEHFIKTSKYKERGEFSLEELDAYTMLYSDEYVLKNSLNCDGIIPSNYYYRQLAIVSVDENGNPTASKTVLYKQAKEFIEDSTKIIVFFKQEAMKKNFDFFEALAYDISKNPNAKELALLISELIQQQSEIMESTYENLIQNLFQLLIHNSQPSPESKALKEINYENLHNLVAFIIEYENAHTKVKFIPSKRSRKRN